MATYRLRLSQTREFKVRSIDHLLQEIASVFLCTGVGMPSLLKNIANVCCDWNGEAYRYGTKEELIADMKKNKILINMDEREANETN